MKLTPVQKLLSDLDTAFSTIKGVEISEKEYNLICERMRVLKAQVLYPAAIMDIHDNQLNSNYSWDDNED